jgi:cell division protein FtsZ
MLAESALPTMRYDVPIQPRVTTPRPSPRFASEAEAEPASSPAREDGAAPELIPVKASVFDDDFFQASSAREGVSAEEDGLRHRESTHFSTPSRVQSEDVRITAEEVSVAEPSVRVPSYGSGGAGAAEAAEPDELDIPAFLRRGN